MEGPPKKENIPNNDENLELSFEEQLNLANTLYIAVEDRNMFIKGQGGFDTFAEAGQYMPGMSESYERMEKAVSEARRDFDEKVPDKKVFVDKLIENGSYQLADRIGKMFGISEK